jgi:solute:Na+ symporter, SSS family
LQLSYFGTDQSQVGRYLTGSSDAQSRWGLVMNALVKIPMQFFILLIGAMVFAFYQYHQPPVFFNPVEVSQIENSKYAGQYKQLETEYAIVHKQKQQHVNALTEALRNDNQIAIESARSQLQLSNAQADTVRKNVAKLMTLQNPDADTNDTNYVFLRFVTTYLPVGLVGLLIAIIFLASMGSTASGLNSLASTTAVDVYKRLISPQTSDHTKLIVSRWSTVGWGVFCVVVALYASKLGNLIEAVNILGSLFYGTILGIFVTAFYVKRVSASAVFVAALVAEVFVVMFWWYDVTSFLWLNPIGCGLVVFFSLLFEALIRRQTSTA